MTPTAPTLTTAELARFIGQQVQVGDNPKQRGELVSIGKQFCVVNYASTSSGHRGEHWYRDVAIRPVLRPISALSEAEAKECFRRAFKEKDLPELKTRVCLGEKWLLISNEPDSLMGNKSLWVGDLFYGRYINHPNMTCSVDAVSVVDYFDSIGVDCREYIQRGLAVEKKA